MNIIVGGRQEGKTFRLVQWYKADPDNRRIITQNYYTSLYLIENYGVDKKHIFTIENKERIRGHTGVFGLDIDLELFFSMLFGFNGNSRVLGPVTINGSSMDARTGEITLRNTNNPYLVTEDDKR